MSNRTIKSLGITKERMETGFVTKDSFYQEIKLLKKHQAD